MSQDLDLDALRALCDAATPGPWYTGQFHSVLNKDGDSLFYADSQEDAEFIATARTAMPALLDVVTEEHIDEVARIESIEELEGDRDRLEARCEALERALICLTWENELPCTVCCNGEQDVCQKCVCGDRFIFDVARFAPEGGDDA